MAEQMDINRFRDLMKHFGIITVEVKQEDNVYISLDPDTSKGTVWRQPGLVAEFIFNKDTGNFIEVDLYK